MCARNSPRVRPKEPPPFPNPGNPAKLLEHVGLGVGMDIFTCHLPLHEEEIFISCCLGARKEGQSVPLVWAGP